MAWKNFIATIEKPYVVHFPSLYRMTFQGWFLFLDRGDSIKLEFILFWNRCKAGGTVHLVCNVDKCCLLGELEGRRLVSTT